jgi:hypothetical protein
MLGQPWDHRRTRVLEPMVCLVNDYTIGKSQSPTHIIANIVDRHQADTGKNSKHDPEHIKLGSPKKLKGRNICTM